MTVKFVAGPGEFSVGICPVSAALEEPINNGYFVASSNDLKVCSPGKEFTKSGLKGGRLNVGDEIRLVYYSAPVRVIFVSIRGGPLTPLQLFAGIIAADYRPAIACQTTPRLVLKVSVQSLHEAPRGVRRLKRMSTEAWGN